MKRLYTLPAALTLIFILSFGVGSLAAQEQPEARVVNLTGRVEVRSTPTAGWVPVEQGQRLPLGATISTGFGASAEIQIGPATLEVRPLSRLTIEELVEREGLVESDLFLQVGRVRAEVRATAGRQSEFRLRSPVATAAVRGTSFEFDGVNLAVQTGSVRLANQFGESVSVGGGESSSSTGDEPPPPPADTREAAATVTVFTAPPGETRGQGTRVSSTPPSSAPAAENGNGTDDGNGTETPETPDDTPDTTPETPSTGGITVDWEITAPQ